MIGQVTATRGAPRVLRGLAMAGCSAALAVAAHTAASGALPPAGLTIVLTALLAGAGIALADRQRGPVAVLAVVGASQLGMHTLLSGHGHVVTGAVSTTGAVMVLAHAAAAVITAGLLAGADGGVFALLAVLHWLLRGSVAQPRPLPAAPRPPGAVSPSAVSVLIEVLLRRVHARRGPPLVA